MSFEHVGKTSARVIERITDAYCLRLLDVQRRHDFDAGDMAEREDKPISTIKRCLERAREIELRKEMRGVRRVGPE